MSNWEIIKVDRCASTNSLLKEKKGVGGLNDKTAILTDFQMCGRGQGSNTWFSDAGQNLLISLFRETGLDIERHFMLTIITSLAIHETLNAIKIPTKIKWPNDIYVADRKIAGILIENSLMQNKIQDTIIGIGLNINQQQFPDYIPNPVSVAQIIQREASINQLQNLVIENIDALFEAEYNGGGQLLFDKYNSLLYRKQEWKMYEADGSFFEGRIRGVMPDGRLVMETQDDELKYFLFGEVKYRI